MSSRRTAVRALATCIVWASVAWSAPAAAQRGDGNAGTQAAEARARQLFERGVRMSQQERWGEALELFRRSREIAERPLTVFNIASVLVRLGRPRDALAAIDDFERLADPDRHRTELGEATRLRQTVEQVLGSLELTVEPEDADVLLDGEPVAGSGRRRHIPLDPGQHGLMVRAEGYTPYRSRISALAGERVSREVVLTPRRSMLRVTSDVSAARIYVDGEQIGQGEGSLELDPGEYHVRVVAEGYDAFEREVALDPGGLVQLEAELDEPFTKKPLFWVLLGAAVVGAGLAAGFATGAFIPEAEPYGGTADLTIEALRTP